MPSPAATWSERSLGERQPMAPTERFARVLGYGLASVPTVGAVVPFALGTGTQSTIVAALAISIALFVLWIGWLVFSRRAFLVRTPLNAPVAILCLVWVLACIASNVLVDPRVALRLGSSFALVQVAAVTVTVISLGLLLLGANLGQEDWYCRVATWAYLAVSVVAISSYYVGLETRLAFLNTNGLFTLWAVALSYGQALFNRRLGPIGRLGLIGLAGAYLFKVVILQTVWLSGWIPALVAVGIITLVRSRLLAGLGIIVAAPFLVAFSDRIFDAVVESNIDEGSDSRLDIWMQAWDLLSQYPVLGTGPAGYAAYYMTLYVGSGSSMSTHSNYVDIAAQTGIIGVVAFLWLLGALGIVAWRACRSWRAGFAGGFTAAAAGGLIGAVIAMALGDWVIPFVYNQGIAGFRYTVHTWVFLGFLAAYAARAAHKTTH
ncbi:MAG: O-antigen ligase family protein [Chloroflexi bacterium]|nr:O-antigen ligase family protein [Chloroflexota bacterium]